MKTVGTLVVLTFLLACWPLSALGGTVLRSKHDLAYVRDYTGGHLWNDYNQVCVYCHTPHHANQAQGALWNRPTPATTYTLYQSATLDSPTGQPGRGSLVCLSCHDGTVAVDMILNQPLYGVVAGSKHGKMTASYVVYDAWENCGVRCHGPNPMFHPAEDTYLGSDLSTEHPISIAYAAVPDLTPAPADGRFANGVRLIGGRVECMSCHNPHDPDTRPFLVTSNGGSALCYTCHVK